MDYGYSYAVADKIAKLLDTDWGMQAVAVAEKYWMQYNPSRATLLSYLIDLDWFEEEDAYFAVDYLGLK